MTKMGKLYKIICLIALCCPFLSVNGERTPKPLIRNDRIWEYYYYQGFAYDQYCVLNRFLFDGKEVIEDTEYDVLWEIETREAVIKYEEIHDLDKYHLIVSTFNETYASSTPRKVAFMREENGKVYAYNLLHECHDYKLASVIEDATDKGCIFIPDTLSKEFLIFDFNLEPDQDHTIWFECFEERRRDDFPTILYPLACKPYETGYVNIDSEECKRINFALDYYEEVENIINNSDLGDDHGRYYPNVEFSLIEGIGPVGNGMLYGPCFFVCKWHSVYEHGPALNRVYNDKNEVIFRGLDIDWKTLHVGELYSDNKSLTYSDNNIVISGVGNANLSIIDTSGRQVLSRAVQGGDQVDISELPAGIYIATLSSGATLKVCHK